MNDEISVSIEEIDAMSRSEGITVESTIDSKLISAYFNVHLIFRKFPLIRAISKNRILKT